MEINYSCCLISRNNSAWFPPTGAPPKPTGEQGTPTQPAGTGRNTTAATAGKVHHHTHVSKLTHVPQGRIHTHTHTQGTQSTLNPVSSSCQKTASEDEITGSATKWAFPAGTLHKPATEQVAAGHLLSYKYSKHPM